MKKTYIAPELLTVEFEAKTNMMLSASDGSGNNFIEDGGEGDGSDIGAKEFTNNSVWDNEW